MGFKNIPTTVFFLCFNIKNVITFSAIFNTAHFKVYSKIFDKKTLKWAKNRSVTISLRATLRTKNEISFALRNLSNSGFPVPWTVPFRTSWSDDPWFFQIFWQSRFMSCTNSLNWIHMPSYKKKLKMTHHFINDSLATSVTNLKLTNERGAYFEFWSDAPDLKKSEIKK